jgi:hypothetical protein
VHSISDGGAAVCPKLGGRPEVAGSQPKRRDRTQKGHASAWNRYLVPLVRGPFRENQMDWSETIQKAVILAEAKGYITFDELNQIIPPKLQSEDIESLMSALSDKGIWVQEE